MKYVALLLLAFLQVMLSIILGHKRRSKVSQTFIYFTGLLFVWTLANTVLDYSLHNATSFFYSEGTRELVLNLANKIGFLTGTLSLLLLYRLVLVFPIETKSGRTSRIISLSGIIIAVAAMFPIISGSYSVTSPEAEPLYTAGSLSILIFVYFIFVAAMSVKTVIGSLRKSVNPLVKKQTKTILAALIATGAMAVFIIILLPIFIPGNDSYIFIGYFAPYVFTTALFYSIFRQGFLDFKAIVARSVGYIFSLGAIVALLTTVAFVLVRWLSGNAITPLQAMLFALFNTAAALAFAPLKKYFDNRTKRFFYRDAYDPQELFDKLNKVLVSTMDLKELLERSSSLIAENLKAEYCSFVLREKKISENLIIGNSKIVINSADISKLRSLTPKLLRDVSITDYIESDHDPLKQLLVKHDIALIARLGAPSNSREEGVGYIILGPKQSGNDYNKQDANILDTIANELVIAIQNALQFVEIQQFNITLQQKVDDATRKLRRANEKLKALDETKDDFISMASHQLRTPLTSVKGYISMVLEGDAGKISKQEREMLNQASFSAQRMVFLIADLLNVSRLKTGKFVIEKSRINLKTMVEQEMNQLKETAASRQLNLSFDSPEHFPDIMLDETKTRQVLMNFIDNAIYYTPAGGHIKVRLVDNPTTIELRVEDDGIGVAKSDQPHLFTKFYRAGNARKARPDGTGLGLFMAKKVVIAEEGSIIFESEEGKGSTFGFIFSKSKVAVDGKAAAPAPEAKAKEAVAA